MGPGFPLLALVALVVCLVGGAPAAAEAQTVSGIVLDAAADQRVAGVTLVLRNESGDAVARARTGEDGRFTLVARSPGPHTLEAERLGYAPLEPRSLTLGRELVEIELRITRAPVEMDPLTVTARRRDPRHEATLEGALTRHEQLPSVGSRRVALRSGPEFVGAIEVEQVLDWFGPRGACTILFRNGTLVHSPEVVEELFIEGPADWWQAVEFYRRYAEAPLGLRDTPGYVVDPSGCSVVALWSRDDPPAPGRSIWARVAWAGGIGLAIWFGLPLILGF